MVNEVHVLWAMYFVKSGFSNNSVDDSEDILKRMCQTDPISSVSNGQNQVVVCDQPWFISTF